MNIFFNLVKKKNEKITLLFITVSFFFSCSSGGGGGDTITDISGCMDECAVNYNEDATIDDNSCLYTFLT